MVESVTTNSSGTQSASFRTVCPLEFSDYVQNIPCFLAVFYATGIILLIIYNRFFIRKECFYKMEVVQIIFQRKKDSGEAALSYPLFFFLAFFHAEIISSGAFCSTSEQLFHPRFNRCTNAS
jgi:hypothetical protein